MNPPGSERTRATFTLLGQADVRASERSSRARRERRSTRRDHIQVRPANANKHGAGTIVSKRHLTGDMDGWLEDFTRMMPDCVSRFDLNHRK